MGRAGRALVMLVAVSAAAGGGFPASAGQASDRGAASVSADASCCISLAWTVTVQSSFGNVVVQAEVSAGGGSYVCVSRVVVGLSAGSGGVVGDQVSEDPDPRVQANCGYTVRVDTILRDKAAQLAGRTVYVQLETVSSPAAKIRGEEGRLTEAKAVRVPGSPVTTPTTTTPTTTTPGSGAKRVANAAQLPADNGKADCRKARSRISYLNQELVKAVKNWNFTAGLKGASAAQFKQIGTRISRLEAELRVALPVAVRSCAAGAAATPVTGQATIIRANGRRQKLGGGAPLAVGDTIRTAGNSIAKLSLPDRSEAVLASDSSLTVGDPARRKAFVQALGEIFYRIKKRLAGQREITLPKCSPNCTASVRGTAFTLAVEGTSVRARVYEGTLAVTSLKQTVLVKNGFESVFGGGKTPTPPTRFQAPSKPFWTTGGGTATTGGVKEFSTTAGPIGVTLVGPTDVCCVDAKIHGTYDATSDRLVVTWALPSGLCFFSVHSGRSVGPDGRINEGLGNLPGRGGVFTGDGTYCGRTGFKVRPTLGGTFYVEIEFRCRSDYADCDPSFADKSVYSRPLKIDL